MKKKNLIGAKVSALRYKRRLSQDALAAQCGVVGWDLSRGTLAKIEAGIRCISDAELVILSAVLHCSPTDLLPKGVEEALQIVGKHGE